MILVLTAGGGLNELSQLSMYPLYHSLSRYMSISPQLFQHIIGVFFLAGFVGSLSITFTNQYGTLTQKYFIGLSLCLLGSITMGLSESSAVFSTGRVFNGIGSGMIYVVCMALVMEFGRKTMQIKMLGLFNVLLNSTLLLSFTTVVFFSSGITTVYLSTFLNHFFSWKMVFALLSMIYLFFIVLLGISKKEIYKIVTDKKKYPLSIVLSMIGQNTTLLKYILAFCLYLMGNIIYLVASPIYFIHVCHLSPVFFSHIFILTILMSVAGSLTATFIKIPKNTYAFCGVLFFILLINIFILFGLSLFQIEGWLTFLISFMVKNYVFSLSMPLLFQLMLSSGGKAYKISASIIQSVSYLVCWIGASIAAFIPENTIFYPSLLILICYLLGFGVFLRVKRH